MRSLKHLKHHTRNNVEESGRLVRCYPKVTEGQMDAGTQTDPVVVLSLAQAAVLGLISQNEIFGATIAPNGFYMGEPREHGRTPPPPEGVEYEYADQLIGANGDYLAEPAGQTEPHGSERRRPGPRGRTRRPRSEGGAPGEPPHRVPSVQAQVKGERTETDTPPSCIHMVKSHSSPGKTEEPATHRGHLKEEQSCANCPVCVRATSSQAQAGTRPDQGTEERSERGGERQEEELAEEDGVLNLKTGGNRSDSTSPVANRYFESSEVAYESADTAAGEYEDSGQGMLWAADAEGIARRMQIDRLDINVQIDESYCVDVGEGLKRWKCRMCEKSYTSKYNLVTHILGHQGIKPHACPHCGKLFKQPSHLQTHLLTHQGTRPHKCAVCKKGFTQTSHLKRHMLQHTDVKPYSCRFCRRGFAYPSELRAHETKHERGRCHVCSQCGMEFPTYAHLKRHQTSHQGPTTYQCTECNKSFAYRSQLQNHLLKHQSPRPYSCSHCGLEFVQLHHLRQHALTHKGMKGHKCDVCSREFTLSANLKRHMLIHNSIRPFQCHVCFKSFIQKQTLKTHMIVHLPVKPFKCKVCGKSFNRMYNLLGHMHLHAGSKPFKCPYCSSKFNLKGNLSRHMKVKHGMDISPDGPEALPEIEGQGEYEEENFDFGASEADNNMDNGGSQNLTKLTTANMDDMDDYYNFGKDAANYSTP